MSVAMVPAGERLSDTERLAWLRLIRSDSIGAITFRELLAHFGSGSAALAAAPELAARSGRHLRLSTSEEAEQELDAIAELGARLVASCEPEYPEWLRHIDDAPPLISVLGDQAFLLRPMVAIVGSRNASAAGRKFAARLAAGLGEHGYVVASGLARGIDAAAHQAALATGTVAVLAGGLDRVYPPENAELARRIGASGAIITEMPMGWGPRARDFPRRNRIVSGLSAAVVVIEAAERSGSLITARLAAHQGRLVFAVPGSPLDPRAAGTNRLIKDGAGLVATVDDVVSELNAVPAISPPPALPDDERDGGKPPWEAGDADREAVLEALGPTPTEIDDIVRFTGLKPAVIHLILLELDLAGRLRRNRGQRVSLV